VSADGLDTTSARPHRSAWRHRADGLTLARIGLVLLAGLLLGVIVHVAAIMGIPAQVPQTAYARIAAFGPDGRFNLLPKVVPGAEPLPMLDPTMMHAACRFDLAEGAVEIAAALPPPFWSFALFNAKGEAIYSLNDRTSGNGGHLDVLIITSEQLAMLRENPPVGLEDMIVIQTEERYGYALLRAFNGDPARETLLRTAMEEARCKTLPVE
jgi:uncharacterized membrane protein